MTVATVLKPFHAQKVNKKMIAKQLRTHREKRIESAPVGDGIYDLSLSTIMQQ